MTYKPVTYGDIYNGFAEQDAQVSISTDVINLTDKAAYKVYWQIEPEEIVPLEKSIIVNHEFYDLILTWNERILSACPNAEKFIFGTCRWAVDPKDDADVSKKRFAVSYLTSSKTMCAGHHLRHEVFKALPSVIGGLPITKHMSPPETDKQAMLYPFQFSVVMENVRRNNWITEKLIDCLVSRTIPIYWGAPNVGEYFNHRGILTFDTYSDLLRVLSSLTPEFYESRLSEVDENLHKAMQYTNHHRRIDEIIKKHLRASNPEPALRDATTSLGATLVEEKNVLHIPVVEGRRHPVLRWKR